MRSKRLLLRFVLGAVFCLLLVHEGDAGKYGDGNFGTPIFKGGRYGVSDSASSSVGSGDPGDLPMADGGFVFVDGNNFTFVDGNNFVFTE